MDLSDFLANFPWAYPFLYSVLNWIYLNVFGFLGLAIGTLYLAPAAALLVAYRVKNGSFALLEGNSLDYALSWPWALTKKCLGMSDGKKRILSSPDNAKFLDK